MKSLYRVLASLLLLAAAAPAQAGGAVVPATNLTAIGLDKKITVHFTPAVSQGCGEITNYQYSTDPNGTSFTVMAPAQVTSPISFTRESVGTNPTLTNNQQYSVRLRPVLSICDGAISAPVTVAPTACAFETTSTTPRTCVIPAGATNIVVTAVGGGGGGGGAATNQSTNLPKGGTGGSGAAVQLANPEALGKLPATVSVVVGGGGGRGFENNGGGGGGGGASSITVTGPSASTFFIAGGGGGGSGGIHFGTRNDGSHGGNAGLLADSGKGSNGGGGIRGGAGGDQGVGGAAGASIQTGGILLAPAAGSSNNGGQAGGSDPSGPQAGGLGNGNGGRGAGSGGGQFTGGGGGGGGFGGGGGGGNGNGAASATPPRESGAGGGGGSQLPAGTVILNLPANGGLGSNPEGVLASSTNGGNGLVSVSYVVTTAPGACGTANGVPTSGAPTNLCATGDAGTVNSSGGQWTWMCNGTDTPATNVSCSAPFQAQSITLNANPTSMAIDGTSTVTASSTSGLLPVVTSTTTSVCSLAPFAGAPGATTMTATGVAAGTCTVKANVAASANNCTSCFQAATEASASITVTKKPQTITFGAAPTLVVGGMGTLSAQASSMLAVTYAANGMQSACSVSGSTVTGLSAGQCSVVANQAGNGTFAAAEQVIQTFTIGQGSQAITGFTATPASLSFGGGTATLSATGGASGQAVTFGAESEVCTVSGTTVTPTGVGTCTVFAKQAGNANYTAAAPVMLNITVAKGSQTLTFGTAPSGVTVDGTGNVIVSSSADLEVTLQSDTPNVCTVNSSKLKKDIVVKGGATVTGVALGTCTVRAIQLGNTLYNAAPQVTQSFAIADNSGIPPSVQDQVPNASGTGIGDGNGDGIQDSLQDNVISLPSVGSGPYLTLVGPAGMPLSNVSSVATPEDFPGDSTAPFAGVAFTVNSVPMGGTVRVEVFFPYNTAINGALKRNVVSGEFERMPNATVRQIGTVKTAVSFDLVDGGPYDADGTINGSIQDPVFPAIVPGSATIKGGGALGGLLLLPLMLVALRRARR